MTAGFVLRSLELNPSVICVLDSTFSISYCNPAWDTFAEQNGGKNLQRESITGKCYLDVIPAFLRPFYEQAFLGVLQFGKMWEHDYECSSPEQYRLCHMQVLPIGRTNLLIENSLFIERLHETRDVFPGDLSRYVAANGLVAMCAHCRRTKAVTSGKWEWVPSFLVLGPAPVSHCLCPTCRDYYFNPE